VYSKGDYSKNRKDWKVNMTVSNVTNRTSAVGTNTIGQVIPFSFPITATSDLVVKTRVTTTGVETTLAETTNYTVTITGDIGGSIIMVTAVPATSYIHIIRDTPMTQALLLETGGVYSATNIEDALDKNDKLSIENADSLDRCLRLPDTDPTTAILDNAVTRAGKYLYFGVSDGAPTVASSLNVGTANISAFGETLIDDANATAALATLGLTVTAFAKTILDDTTAAAVKTTLGISPYTNVEFTNVVDYGATGDGTTDDTSAIQAAITATDAGGVVFFPNGNYVCSGITIQKPLRLLGTTNSDMPYATVYEAGSVLKAKTGGNSYIITISKDTVLDSEGQLWGVVIENLSLDGGVNTTRPNMGGLYLSGVDHCTFNNVTIQRLAKEGINCHDEVRECTFTNIRIRYCGNRNTAGTSYPALNLTENGTVDSHNFLYFSNVHFVYSMGDAVWMNVIAGAANEVRNIGFSNCIFHGLIAAVDASPYTLTTDEKATTLVLLKGGQYIKFTDCDFYFSGIAKPAIDILSSDKTAPTTPKVVISGGIILGHYDGTTGYGINLQTGYCAINDVHFSNQASGAVKTAVNTNLYWGFGNDCDGGFSAPVLTSLAINTSIQTLYSAIATAPGTLADTDQTPYITNSNVWLSGTTTVTIIALYGGVAGQQITIISKGAVTYDTTSNARLIGSSADIVTASGDVTAWVCEVGGTTSSIWRLVGFVDVSADNHLGA
jgi:hypothetical protein